MKGDELSSYFDPSNREIVERFILVTLGKEENAQRPSKLVKWKKPIRVALRGMPTEFHRRIVDGQIKHVKYLTDADIAWDTANAANFVFLFTPSVVDDSLGRYRELTRRFFLNDEDMSQTIERYRQGPGNCFVSAVFNHDAQIGGALVVASPAKEHATIYECIIKGMMSGLGLAKRSSGVGYSMFNDPELVIDLTEQDGIFLRILFDKRITAGMSTTEARSAAASILLELRPGR